MSWEVVGYHGNETAEYDGNETIEYCMCCCSLQAAGFLYKYTKLRGRCQETWYNLGRAFHQLGMIQSLEVLYIWRSFMLASFPHWLMLASFPHRLMLVSFPHLLFAAYCIQKLGRSLGIRLGAGYSVESLYGRWTRS